MNVWEGVGLNKSIDMYEQDTIWRLGFLAV